MPWIVPCFFLFVSFFNFEFVAADDRCRTEFNIQGMALKGCVFKKMTVTAAHMCDVRCEREITCQSYNYVRKENLCELNNRTKEARPKNFRSDPARFYIRRLNGRAPLGSIRELPAQSCQEIKASEGKDTISDKYWLDPTGNGTAILVYCDMILEDMDECITGNHDCDVNANCTNTIGSHNCTCKEGFTGDGRLCSDFDECITGNHDCDVNANCTNTIGSHNCTCKEGFTGDGRSCSELPLTCREIYDRRLSKGNRPYLLKVGFMSIAVYCHMTNLSACGEGGWTLVMKINGTQKTFHYDSNLWRNKETFNLEGGKTGFDYQETKLPTYWNTPFSKICLGMKIGQQDRFIVINKTTSSLYSLVADGQYRNTSLGRDTWKTLIGLQASLQVNCKREGFNVMTDNNNDWPKARIGILGNNENNCNTSDTRIGFGTGGGSDNSNTCGNEAHKAHGDTHIKAMGYILVQ